jgi:hypothetical protein
MFSAHLIQQYGKKHRHDQIKDDLSHGYNQGVAENVEGIGKHEHIFEIIQTHPF